MNWETFGIILAGFLSLMMFSFIFKDNPFFKFGEHLYLGVGIGYYANIYWFNYILPQVVWKLYPASGPPSPDLTFPEPMWIRIIPTVLGIFILLRLIPRIAWLSRLSFATYIGGFAGINLTNVINGLILKQLVAATVAVVFAAGAIGQGVNGLIIFIATFCVLVYFFFSIEHKGIVGILAKVGIYVLMITFGASFGYTVMARMSLLIGRFQFLLFEWLKVFGINLSPG